MPVDHDSRPETPASGSVVAFEPASTTPAQDSVELDRAALEAAVEAARETNRRVRRGAIDLPARMAAGDERVIGAAIRAYLALAHPDPAPELIAVLEPFADAADIVDAAAPADLAPADETPCEDVLWRGEQPTVGALRRAAALLRRLQGRTSTATGRTAAPSPAGEAAAAVARPTGELTYAIGDVHGRFDLLQAAADRIVSHSQGRPSRIIFLGDYVDRGPQSRSVIEFLMRAGESGVVCLKGNHEAMMVEACRSRDPERIDHWMSNGGDATLLSYGARRLTVDSLDLVPEAHLDWLESLPTLALDDHRIFVHAGLLPGVSADEQDDETHLWIRERFLRASGLEAFPDGKHIVHGHTPAWAGKPDPAEPELLPHRSNLDTAAYYSGVLSVGVFDAGCPGGPLEVLRVAASG